MPGFYSRIFPPTQPPLDPQLMGELGRRMQRNQGTFTAAHTVTMLPAGYTYFGQFIDHDITRDDTFLEDAGKAPPEQTPNLTGPWLDLNQLYGEGPESGKSRKLYDDDGASFRLGGRGPAGEEFDVPLDWETNEPLLADDRDNENVIIRQVHAIFLKLHNAAVQELGAGPALERFKAAQQRVRWQYQWLIRHDYLREICNPEAYKAVINKGDLTIDWDKKFSIPIEFSQAAFRFGHSMVREEYRLNANPPVSLSQLFKETQKARNLPAELAIDWARFIDTDTLSETAMAIDTTLVPSLFCLPVKHFHHFISDVPADQPPELPVRTLVRGAATGLPTGEEVSCAFGRTQLRESESFTTTVNPWILLDEVGLRGRTPLWYHILLEAEQQQDGRRLGYVGSRIVAEVMEASLRADPDSYLNNTSDDWTPPPWTALDGREIAARKLIDLTKIVGLYRSSR